MREQRHVDAGVLYLKRGGWLLCASIERVSRGKTKVLCESQGVLEVDTLLVDALLMRTVESESYASIDDRGMLANLDLGVEELLSELFEFSSLVAFYLLIKTVEIVDRSLEERELRNLADFTVVSMISLP